MFVLKLFDSVTQPNYINFDSTSLWVHMNNLPLACMTYQMGVQIRNSMGKVEEVDAPKDDVGWGNHFKMKIEIDLRKAIARGRTIMLDEQKLWVPFTYEKLPKLFFKCGCII